MPKRIIICCDGTWNEPRESDRGTESPSNVYKFYHALKGVSSDGMLQKAYYDQGVGTGAFRVLCGMTGSGISKNIKEAYGFICRYYQPGDEIFLLGFSRGAYTARSVSGLIWNCGILKREYAVKKTEDAYKLYRGRDSKAHPSGEAAKEFRKTFSHTHEGNSDVKFIGVWDTVGALGLPLPGLGRLLNRVFHRNTFHDVELNSGVKYAFHALAADEKRLLFAPSLWQQTRFAKDPANNVKQHIEQVWFAGSHSNVGGGYQDTGLSDLALEWMIEKAESCGLAFDADYIKKHSHDNHLGELRNSRTLIYKPFRVLNRQRGSGVNEAVHHSLERRKTEDNDYRPVEF
ncbi:MAG: hypothetical protein FD123_3141 [Bacteroidetes bacterium]|nr:MAG: hypothetical protein FD123_3141 [Bacteroidota bacterium]